MVYLGYLLFKEFCENLSEEPVPQMSFYDEVCFYIIKWLIQVLISLFNRPILTQVRGC